MKPTDWWPCFDAATTEAEAKELAAAKLGVPEERVEVDVTGGAGETGGDMISFLAQQREKALRNQYHALERVLTKVLHENCVKDECLTIAIKALREYANTFTGAPGYALSILVDIEQRLAQLKPEEKAK